MIYFIENIFIFNTYQRGHLCSMVFKSRVSKGDYLYGRLMVVFVCSVHPIKCVHLESSQFRREVVFSTSMSKGFKEVRSKPRMIEFPSLIAFTL